MGNRTIKVGCVFALQTVLLIDKKNPAVSCNVNENISTSVSHNVTYYYIKSYAFSSSLKYNKNMKITQS